MQTAAVRQRRSEAAAGLQADTAHWYAVYTCPRHEKKVAHCLESRGLECFLPLYNTAHRWTDRTVTLELPLFPSYVFVRIPLEQRLRVITAPRVLRMVEFNGRPAPLQDSEIEAIRTAVALNIPTQPCASLTAGQQVVVKSGPFRDLKGCVVRQKNQSWIVITIRLIQQSVMVALNAADVEPAN